MCCRSWSPERAAWPLLAALALVACADGAAPSSAGGAGSPAAGGAGGGSLAGSAGSVTVSGGSETGGAAGGSSAGTGGAGGAAGTTATGSGGQGGAGIDPGPIKHHVMAIEYPGRLLEISAEGEKLWEHQTPSLTVMFNVLPSGNVFFPHGGDKRGAQEIDRQHNVVWSYESTAGELLGGERLPNGNSLLGEGGPARALELDAAKQVVRSIPVATTETQAHGQIRHVHRLASGNVLVSLESEGVARELDPSGNTVWEFAGVTKIHSAIRLASGNTLIGGGESKRVIEVTSAGQVAWEFSASDAPELGLAWITSVQPLKNGNVLVCNWLGASGGAGVHAFEVTRDKQVVWKLDDHTLLKSATMVTALDD
jgi:hypothetical protein